MDLVENSLTDAIKSQEAEVLDSLKLDTKEERRDDNQASETLSQTKESIDDKFDRSTRRLKDLEKASSPSWPTLDSSRSLMEKNPKILRKRTISSELETPI